MKRFIAVASASALLVVGTAFVVHAQTAGGILPCADITGGDGTYTSPTPGDLLNPATAGRLTWEMSLAGVSCPDVQYQVTVFLNGVSSEDDSDPPLAVSPVILASAATPGDTISQVLSFDLEVNSNELGSLCVVASTVGGSSAPTSSKNGAAFDADGSGSSLLDRDPDGPEGGDKAAPGVTGYCATVDAEDGSGGRTAG